MRQTGKTDILLVVPDLPSSSWLNAMAAGVTPPLGIAYVASYLISKGFTVEILDNCLQRLSGEQFLGYLQRVKPKTIGFTATTTTFPRLVELAAIAKKYERKIPVIVGGPHASALPKETAVENCIDIVVKGEGEETAAALLHTLFSGDDLAAVKGITYKREGNVVDNPRRESITDINTLPFPAYALLDMEKYHPSLSRRLTAGNFGSVITSRGCTYCCSFCSNSVFGVGLRKRNPQNVLEEIGYLVNHYAVSELIIWDDTFTIDQQHAREIASGIRGLGKEIRWSCYSRVDHASEDLYEVFYQSGCREILFGAESGSQQVLDASKKEITVQETEKAVALCKKYKISSFCSVILGLPLDTKESILKTIKFFIKINPDYAVFCILVPMPGSELFDLAVRSNLIDIKNANWADYVKLFSSRLPPVSLCALSRQDLVKLQKKAFKEFFFRPAYILGRLKKCMVNNGVAQVVRFGRGLITIIKHQFHKLQ